MKYLAADKSLSKLLMFYGMFLVELEFIFMRFFINYLMLLLNF